MTLKFSLRENDSYHQILEEKILDLKALANLDERDLFEVNLILDEICTNIFEHNSIVGNLIVNIDISFQKKYILIVITDNGAPFDPTSTVSPDTNLPLDKRTPGGLGILLVKKFSTHLWYERLNDINKTTIEKKF